MEKCTCVCHSESGVRHVVNCCLPCDNCQSNIRRSSFEEHKMNCLFGSIIGLEVEKAKDFVNSVKYSESTNYEMRITKLENVNLAITMDLRFARINVEVLDGKVSKIVGLG